MGSKRKTGIRDYKGKAIVATDHNTWAVYESREAYVSGEQRLCHFTFSAISKAKRWINAYLSRLLSEGKTMKKARWAVAVAPGVGLLVGTFMGARELATLLSDRAGNGEAFPEEYLVRLPRRFTRLDWYQLLNALGLWQH